MHAVALIDVVAPTVRSRPELSMSVIRDGFVGSPILTVVLVTATVAPIDAMTTANPARALATAHPGHPIGAWPGNHSHIR